MTYPGPPDDRRIRSVLDTLVGAAGTFHLEAIPSHSYFCRKASRGAEAFLVKIAVKAGGAQDLLQGAEAQRLAAARGARVAELVAVVDIPNELGYPFLIQRWVPGHAGMEAVETLNDSGVVRLARSLGRNVALIHSAAPLTGRHSHAQRLQVTDWRSQCAELLTTRARACEKAANIADDLLRAIVGRCKRLLDRGVADVAPGLAHWDLHMGNVIVDDAQAATVLDFDRAKLGDPLIDFVKLDTTLFSRYPGSFAPFIEAYTAVLPVGPSWSSRVYLYQGIEYLSAVSLLHAFPEEAPHYRSLILRWLANDRQRWNGPAGHRSA